MDVLSQNQLSFASYDVYVEKYNIFRLFQYILERIIVDRPEDPIGYLQQLLLRGFSDVHQIFLFGAPTTNRKILSSSLELKFHLVHLTRTSLLQHADPALKGQLDSYKDYKQVPATLWADLTKHRIEKADSKKKGFILEGFPRTREQAFLMQKKGVFPTHVVIIEEREGDEQSDAYCIVQGNSLEEQEETEEFRAECPMIADFFKDRNIRSFTFSENFPEVIKNVEDFVRDKEPFFVPYVPRVLLFGPPGSGKKTLASMLSSKYPIKKVSLQEILSQAAKGDSPFKQELHQVLCKDEPVPDELLAKITAAKLKEQDFIQFGWILYDFPFNLTQAELLTNQLEGCQINKAIFLEAELDTCLLRLEPRRLDPETGTPYHLLYNPPPNKDIESRLIQRQTDTKREIVESYHAYRAESVSLQGYYSREMAEDITFYVNANEDDPDSVLEVLESLILGPSRRKPPASTWWDWSTRNAGIY